MIEQADARDWLPAFTEKPSLILTDPPHLDTFGEVKKQPDSGMRCFAPCWESLSGHTCACNPGIDPFNKAKALAAHKEFVKQWLPAALDLCPYVIHSCGEQPGELDNYLSVRVPSRLLVWQFEGGKHFYLLHGLSGRRWPTVLYDGKPDPLYYRFIMNYVPRDGLVVDPFAGRGEIPHAARRGNRRFAGCEILEESVAACRVLGLA